VLLLEVTEVSAQTVVMEAMEALAAPPVCTLAPEPYR
jgi:hypothetical protein